MYDVFELARLMERRLHRKDQFLRQPRNLPDVLLRNLAKSIHLSQRRPYQMNLHLPMVADFKQTGGILEPVAASVRLWELVGGV